MECLVTKLKSAINNDSLDILGSIDFFVNKWSPTYVPSLDIKVKTGNECKVILPDGEYFTTSDGVTPLDGEATNVKVLDSTWNSFLYFSYVNNEPYRVIVTNGAGITKLKPSFSNGNIITNTDTLKYQYMTSATDISGNNFFGKADIGSKFNILDFCHSKTLANLAIQNKNIAGTVESIVELQWGLGRRSTRLFLNNCLGTGSSLTLNGNPIASLGTIAQGLEIVFSSSDVKVNNGNHTNLATYDGSTWTYVE